MITIDKKRIIYPLTLFILGLIFINLIFILYIGFAGSKSYDDLTSDPIPFSSGGRFTGNIYSYDPVLGPVLTPSANGSWLIPYGKPVPTNHDRNGFHAPFGISNSFQGIKHPRILFLGDSFTYGELVKAEDTFPYKAAQLLGGEALNAGVPGYGLAQMVLQARKLIPKFQPDYVVIQYSPWLVERSLRYFYSGTEGRIMAPYFFKTKTGYDVTGVAFSPNMYAIKKAELYKQSKKSLFNRTSYIIKVAIPFSYTYFLNFFIFKCKLLLGKQPSISNDPNQNIKYTYAEIQKISHQYGAKPIILALGNHEELQVPEALFPPHIAGVHAWKVMVSKLNPPTLGNYVDSYYLVRGNPPQPVDAHPNEHAHTVIAEAIADRITELEQKKHSLKAAPLPNYLYRTHPASNNQH